MRGLLCRWLGHRWRQQVTYAPVFYSCTRCKEPGFWIGETP